MTDLAALNTEGLTALLIRIADHGESQGLVTLEDGETEKCLTTLTLPKGFADSAKSFFSEEMCKTCPDQDCEKKDSITNELLDAIFRLGVNTIIDVGLKHADMQEM